MNAHSVFLPAYSIGTEVYSKVYEICASYGKKAVLIGGQHALNAAGERLKAALAGTDFMLTECLPYQGATLAAVKRLALHPAVQNADMIFAMGGGRCMDLCKALAYKVGKPVFTFPTTASNCAACTSFSVLYEEDGAFHTVLNCPKPPAHAFIDLQVIITAPVSALACGMGGMLAMAYEQLLGPATHLFGPQAMARHPVQMYGEQALKDAAHGLLSHGFSGAVLDIIVRTGLAAMFAEQSFAVNSAINEDVFQNKAISSRRLHHLPGELAAYGVLVLLTCQKHYEERYHLFTFCHATGLPSCLYETPFSMACVEDLLWEAAGDTLSARDTLRHAILDMEAFNAMHRSHAV